MILSGAQAVVECLKKENVDTVFGYPGGVALPLYDALYNCGIHHILTRHEQGAAHAADGYARSSGRVGVCISTSGPGATNLVTGIATANIDSVPMVCITCQVTTDALGKDSFQEADITGITAPISKHNFMIHTVESLPEVMTEAFYIASTGRPGPVIVDIPKDVLVSKAEFAYPEKPQLKGYKPVYSGDESMIRTVVNVLKQAKKPVFFIGGGVMLSDMADVVLELVNKTGIPVTASMMGLASLDKKHPLHLGMLGMHGTYAANLAVTNCDLLITLGARFDDRVTGAVSKFAPNATIVQFDIDPSEINKIIPTNYCVLADLKWSLPIFTKMVSACDIKPWVDEVLLWKKEHPLRFKEDTANIKPQAVICAVDEAKANDAFVVTDVGQHQMWTAQYAHFGHPRALISSAGLGTMGYGLPAAIGAQAANPEREVWLFSGDGSIMMNCQELATAVEQNLPIKIFILNNQGLGMVRQWQRMFYGKRYSGSKHEVPTNFQLLAEAFGAKGLTVHTKEELKYAVTYAKACKGPILVNVFVEEEENVMPMVPPGTALDQIVE